MVKLDDGFWHADTLGGLGYDARSTIALSARAEGNMSVWMDLQTVGAAWASAVATAGATGTALWLALSDRRQRKVEREAAARLLASGVAVYLEELRLELNTALASISEAQRRETQRDMQEFLALVAGNIQSLNTDFLSTEEFGVLSLYPTMPRRRHT